MSKELESIVGFTGTQRGMTSKQQNTFKESLDKISESFLSQIATSNEWHKSHAEHLSRIEE